MFYRRKIFLSLLKVHGGKMKYVDFKNLLFLFCQFTKTGHYDFFPYEDGPHSFIAQLDKEILEKNGYLKKSPDCELKKKDKIELKKEDKIRLNDFTLKFDRMRGDDLLNYIFEEYPFYAVKYNNDGGLLNMKQLKKVKEFYPSQNKRLFTIGYEGQSIDSYINKLIANNIALVIDVRKNPLSMKYGFSKNRMKNYLETAGISYLHMPELGIESGLRKGLKTKSDFLELFDYYYKNILPDRKELVSEIISRLNKHKRIALTCYEADHTSCHRNKITEWMLKKGVVKKVMHI